MKHKIPVWLFAAPALMVPAAALADLNYDAAIVVHVTAATTKNPCSIDLPICGSINTQGLLDPNVYNAYIVATDINPGILGVRFGVAYDGAPGQGVDIDGWHRCADSEFPSDGWPDPGTGNSIGWISCHDEDSGNLNTNGIAVVGYFRVYAYSPDELRIIPHPIAEHAQLADCSGDPTDLPYFKLGWAVFSADGSKGGNNPCGFSFNGGQSCHLEGPDYVEEGQQDIQYAIRPEEWVPHGVWYITGTPGVAEIVGDNTAAAVTVNALAAGTFRLNYNRCYDAPDAYCGCWVDVTVDMVLPVHATTWGEIKARYRR